MKTITELARDLEDRGYTALSGADFRKVFRSSDTEIRITSRALDRAILKIKAEIVAGFIFDIEATYVSKQISNEKSLSSTLVPALEPTVVFVLQSHAFIKSSRR